jgi:pimeloyl-ACP methyl ester carboxylesterase
MLAVSGGAPFALAAAARQSGRITRLAMVSGLGPLPASLSGMTLHPLLCRAFALARQDSLWLTPLCLAAVVLARRCTAQVVTQIAAHLPAPDRALLHTPALAQAMIASTREALRQGARAVRQSLRLYARDWGIALDRITVPIVLWHGEADVVVPPPLARQLVAALPRCETHFVPGEGHYSLPLCHTDAILRRLLDGNQ